MNIGIEYICNNVPQLYKKVSDQKTLLIAISCPKHKVQEVLNIHKPQLFIRICNKLYLSFKITIRS